MVRMIGVLAGLALTCSFSTTASAQEYAPERFGDWAVVHVNKDMFMAGVTNSAGARFGSMCSKSGCVAFFNLKIECEKNHKYPALINAPSAAYSVELLCEKFGDLTFYTLSMEGVVAEAMSVGGVLGIAFPMKSGEFRVARFSLTGSARASARAQQLSRWVPSNQRQNANDDFSL